MQSRSLSVLALALSLASAPGAAAQDLTLSRTDHASSSGARTIVAADFNRDGWPDVAHAGLETTSVSVLLNDHGEGLARTSAIPVGTGPFDMTGSDFNRDGIPDLAVANADSNSISILIGRGDGRFIRSDLSTTPHGSPRGIAAADVNEDGKPDLVFAAYDGAAVVILLGDGAGAFSRQWELADAARPQGVATGDLNRDGHLDVAVAHNAAEGLIVWYGSASAFTPARVPGACCLNILAVADLNADGWLDVAAAATDRGRVAIYVGTASGLVFTRSYAVDSQPRGITIADVNIDGVPDVMTASRGTNTVNVLPGDPAQRGSFLPRLTFSAGVGSRAVAATDFDADGLLDLAIGNQYADAVSVLSNVTPLSRAGYTFGRLTLPAGAELSTQRPASGGRGFAAADVNRDGTLDFVARVADADAVAVLLTGGATVGLPGLDLYAVEDFNDDENADVVVSGSGRLVTYLGDGRGRFSASMTTPAEVEGCVPGDMNRDGRLDLVCIGQVMLGNGSGTFTRGSVFASAIEGNWIPDPQVADLNRDGKLDVVSGAGEIWFGDGTGGLTHASILPVYGNAVRVADLNHDGYPDLVFAEFGGEQLHVRLGSAAGYQAGVSYGVADEMGSDFVIADITADGNPDILVNPRGEDAGVMSVLLGTADGTFGASERFALVPEIAMPAGGVPGAILVADVNRDGLPDVIAAGSGALHVLVGEHNEVNHPPSVPDYAVTGTYPCARLDANAIDQDQHALFVEWFGGDGVSIGWGIGSYTFLDPCFDRPGTYQFRRTVSDRRGAVASGTVTVTVTAGKEIVLYAADGDATLRGGWIRVPDPTAAGGARAYDPDAGRPKAPTPQSFDNFVTLRFSADSTLIYKLWVRLKADGDYWGNDSIWLSFNGWMGYGGATDRAGNPVSWLPINLEECLHCGVAGWGWEDDGWGAINRNGRLLRFPAGGWQEIVIARREDGVSIDQIVLSAEKYLTTRPGAARNDTTILSRTQGAPE